jgi:hypothetical protein
MVDLPGEALPCCTSMDARVVQNQARSMRWHLATAAFAAAHLAKLVTALAYGRPDTAALPA